VLEPGQIGAPAIMGLTIAISLLGLFKLPAIIQKFLFRPYFFLRHKQYDTMIMSGFIHADVGHLLFNMFTFYFFAFAMERLIGTSRFLILYFVGLILSHTCTYVKHRNHAEYASLGASGAVSAVLFAYIVYFPTATLIIFPLPIPIPLPDFDPNQGNPDLPGRLQGRGIPTPAGGTADSNNRAIALSASIGGGESAVYYFDAVSQAVSGGRSSTTAMAGSTETAQFEERAKTPSRS